MVALITGIVVATITATFTWFITSQQQDKAFAEQRKSFEKQERWKVLQARHDKQESFFEEWHARWQIPFRNREATVDEMNKEVQENAPFHARALMLFDSHEVASAVWNTFITARDHHGVIFESCDLAEAKMIECMNKIRQEIGLNLIVPNERIQKKMNQKKA